MRHRTTDRVEAPFLVTQLARVELPSGSWYEMGYRRTRDGLIGIYRQVGLVRFTVIRNGREYERTVWDNLTDLGVSRTASRFARDVASGKLDPKRQRRAAGRTK